MPAESGAVKHGPGTGGISLEDAERVSLCETLDRVLNKGAVVVGQVAISVADVELVYLGLELVLTSMETARKMFDSGRASIRLDA